ncbi:MAG: hypothetical protein ACFFDN_23425 [Candidatus Hodarchaeota archaeon]
MKQPVSMWSGNGYTPILFSLFIWRRKGEISSAKFGMKYYGAQSSLMCLQHSIIVCLDKIKVSSAIRILLGVYSLTKKSNSAITLSTLLYRAFLPYKIFDARKIQLYRHPQYSFLN